MTEPDSAPETPYTPSVAALLTVGEQLVREEPWPDYPGRFGLAAEHVPELIRLATDRRLSSAGVDEQEMWAPTHAWRALGQLRATEAAAPLADLLSWLTDDEFALNELPTVFGMLGREAIPPVRALAADENVDVPSRIAAFAGLRRIAEHNPELRNEAVAPLVEQLGDFAANDPEINGLLIAELVDLRATETAPLIEQAFAADAVDISVVGDWEDVQVALGLLHERLTPRPNYHAGMDPFASAVLGGAAPQPSDGKRAAKEKQKQEKQKKARRRKVARESRKRNRKKR